MGDAAGGDGVWIGRDLLVAAARLAGGRVWDRLHRELLRQLRDADRIDWRSRGCTDSSSVAAKRGVPRQARPPPIEVGRAPNGSVRSRASVCIANVWAGSFYAARMMSSAI